MFNLENFKGGILHLISDKCRPLDISYGYALFSINVPVFQVFKKGNDLGMYKVGYKATV